jgi:hypothetical protein
MRNYGDLLLCLARAVPDGIVCFFVSAAALEQARRLTGWQAWPGVACAKWFAERVARAAQMLRFWERDSEDPKNTTLGKLRQRKLVLAETPDPAQARRPPRPLPRRRRGRFLLCGAAMANRGTCAWMTRARPVRRGWARSRGLTRGGGSRAQASGALRNYRRACDTGRGAILLCVATGRMAAQVR